MVTMVITETESCPPKSFIAASPTTEVNTLGLEVQSSWRGVLKKITHSDGCYEHGKGRDGSQGLVRKALYDYSENRTHRYSQQHADSGREIPAECSEKANICADHNNVAMREIQHFRNTVDHRVAQSDDGVNAAQTYSAYKIGEEGHCSHTFISHLRTL